MTPSRFAAGLIAPSIISYEYTIVLALILFDIRPVLWVNSDLHVTLGVNAWVLVMGEGRICHCEPVAKPAADSGGDGPAIVTGTLEADLRHIQLLDDIYHNEIIETGDESATEFVFLDETKLALGPNSRLVLDRFVYDPEPDKASFVMTATAGVFRFVSGKLPKKSYEIHTATATIGIRGTVFSFNVIATYVAGIISFSTYHGIMAPEVSVLTALGHGASWPGIVFRALVST